MKKGDYSFRRESSGEPNEDLVLSDPSSDERGSDGSRENSPALGRYNSTLLNFVFFPRPYRNWRMLISS